MNESLTIRLTSTQRRALRARAKASGQTESEVVRGVIERELQGKGTVGQRAGHLFGRLDFDPAAFDSDARRAHIRTMNVRR